MKRKRNQKVGQVANEPQKGRPFMVQLPIDPTTEEDESRAIYYQLLTYRGHDGQLMYFYDHVERRNQTLPAENWRFLCDPCSYLTSDQASRVRSLADYYIEKHQEKEEGLEHLLHESRRDLVQCINQAQKPEDSEITDVLNTNEELKDVAKKYQFESKKMMEVIGGLISYKRLFSVLMERYDQLSSDIQALLQETKTKTTAYDTDWLSVYLQEQLSALDEIDELRRRKSKTHPMTDASVNDQDAHT